MSGISVSSADNIIRDTDALKSVSFLGYNICDEEYDRILEYFRYSVFNGDKHTLIAFNPKKVAQAGSDPEVRKALEGADILGKINLDAVEFGIQIRL